LFVVSQAEFLIFVAMKTIIFSAVVVALACCSISCRKCYKCTAQTEFGELEREICGQKSNIKPLIDHLTSYTDSTGGGVGPWTCE